MKQGFYAGRCRVKSGLEVGCKPLGTDAQKALFRARSWLIATLQSEKRRFNCGEKSTRTTYVHESPWEIATGFLITALHNAGISDL